MKKVSKVEDSKPLGGKSKEYKGPKGKIEKTYKPKTKFVKPSQNPKPTQDTKIVQIIEKLEKELKNSATAIKKASLLAAHVAIQNVKVSVALEGATFDDMTNHLLLEVVRFASIQDQNAGRTTTIRSIERRFDISRSTVASRLKKMIETSIVTKDEIEQIFRGRWGND